MDSSGAWAIALPNPNWNFGGHIETSPGINLRPGSGRAGAFQQISFDYAPAGVHRSAAIRLYRDRALALFFLNYVDASENANPFPVISSYPQLSHLTFLESSPRLSLTT